MRIVYVRDKFVCCCCERIESPVLPAQVIEKGIPTAELLTHVIINKLEFHLPLYRQQTQFSRMGMPIAMSTLCGWLKQVGTQLLPLAQRLKEKMVASRVIHIDEHPLLLFDYEHKKRKR